MASSDSSLSRSASPEIPSPSSASLSVDREETASADHVDPQYLELFCQSIEKIKKQKQRPDFKRLVQAIKPEKSGVKEAFIEQQLQLAIKEGHLFKVYHKGEPSYKDTAALRKLRRYTVGTDKQVQRAVRLATREIGEEEGTVERDIRNYVKYTFDSVISPEDFAAAVEKALAHETSKGNLVLNNRRYKPVNRGDDEEDGSLRSKSMSSTPAPNPEEKKPKKKRKKTNGTSEEPGPDYEDPQPSTSGTTKPKLEKVKNRGSDEYRFRGTEDRSLSKSFEKSGSKATSSSSKANLSDPKISAKSPAKPESSATRTKPSEEKSPSKPRTPDSKSNQTPAKPSESSAVPSKPKPSSDERTQKLRALLEDRGSKMRSPDGGVRSPVKNEKEPSVEETMRPPTSSEPAGTKKSFQKAVKLNELIKQRNVRPLLDDDDDLRPSTSAVVPPVEKKEKEKPIEVQKVEVPKKKRGRPFKNKPPAVPADQPPKPKPRSPSPPAVKSEDDVTAGIIDPGFEESIPKELRDGLSKYFTPSLKRKSRVAISTLLNNQPHSARARSKQSQSVHTDSHDDNSPKPSTSRRRNTGDSKRVEKSEPTESSSESESSQDSDEEEEDDEEQKTEKKRRSPSKNQAPKKRGKKLGSTQLKGLQDGLSRYFTAAGDRKRRPPPVYQTSDAPRKKSEFASSRSRDVTEASHSDSEIPGKDQIKSADEEKSDGKEKEEKKEKKKPGRKPRPRLSEGRTEISSPTGSAVTSLFKLPDTISKWDESLFRKARERALKKIPTVNDDYDGPLPPRIYLGDKKVHTWYTSPFPEEYIRCRCLYMCEFCLQYMKTVNVLKSHYDKCPWHRPPGNEIYRDTVVITGHGTETQQELVIYETDGNEWKEYCQNICLLAKLYLDHKTLYYDVEPFLFYVLCRRDKYGDHLIGYFSKEKNSPQRYNVSCIMVLPPFQGDGYGRYLIDFSYLLSRRENQHGTPEKPLSELGQLSYHAYWRSAILDFFLEQRSRASPKTSIQAICDATGMWPQDVADTLRAMGFLLFDEEARVWHFNMIRDVLDAYEEKKSIGKKRIPLFPEKLHWAPWCGDVPGMTTATEESDTNGSRTDQQAETGDDQKNGNHMTGSSESEIDQAMDTRSPPAHSSPRLPSAARSRTPKASGSGKPSSHKSYSRERSPSEEPVPHALPAVARRRPGRPPKNLHHRPRGRVREDFFGAASRRKRKGKFRSSAASTAGTSSQPKNYKGRREELRAGSEKRRKQQHQQPGDSGDESDISSFYSQSRRSSMSESSADESLASVSSYKRPSGPKPSYRKEVGDDSSSSSSEISTKSMSHLDQPPRAPHPPEPIDMMDQGIVSADSPPMEHHVIEPPVVHQPTSRNRHLSPVIQQEHRVAEICIQTEPVELPPLPVAVVGLDHGYKEPKSQHSMPQDYPQVHIAEAQAEVLVLQQPLVSVMGQDIIPAGPVVLVQQQSMNMPLSPPMQLLQQPRTPAYHMQQASPVVAAMGSVTNPGSVLSMHEAQMAQDTEMVMSQPTYDATPFDQYGTPQHTPGIVAMSPGFPQQQSHQQASPAAAQGPYSAAAYPQESPHTPRSQQAAVAAYDMGAAHPHTPTTPAAQAAYMNPSPRPAPFVENVSSPHAARVMQTPHQMQPTYQDTFARATASAVPFEQPRTSRTVSTSHGLGRVSVQQTHAVQQQQQQLQAQQVQQQQYADCAAAQDYYNQRMVEQSAQHQLQLQLQHKQQQQQLQQQQQPQHQQHHHHSQQSRSGTRKSSGHGQRYTAAESSVPAAAYTQVANQSAAQSAPFMFPGPYGQGMLMPYGMPEQHQAYMTHSPDSSHLAKLQQLAQALPPAGMQHPGMGSYGSVPVPVAVSAQQRSSQGHTRQQQQHHMNAGMSMQMSPGMPGMSPYMQKGMQGFSGQPSAMPGGYPQAFFGPNVPMGQVGSGQYRGVAPGQTPQSMYGYPYGYPSGAQHPHSSHHAGMRQ